MGDLYHSLHRNRRQYLNNAWHRVRANGLVSSSKVTRDQIREFDEVALVELPKIARQLRELRFRFGAQRGVPIEKKKGSGKFRPVVLAPIENRIVQRALLDLLQDRVPAVKDVLATPTSIGGVAGRGTRHAISLVMGAIESGATHFASSDISGFFTKIPRQRIVDFVANACRDEELTELFRQGIETTLQNDEELGHHRDLFPIGESGVAQGSPLSPLMGNILLKDFDDSLNGRGIVCVRYIDDFVILGPSERAVDKAMSSAREMLKAFGMSLYDPETQPDKAAKGPVTKAFNFLGCQISPGLVAPSKDARERVLQNVQRTVKEGKKSVDAAAKSKQMISPMQCQIQTLTKIDGILKGWGHAFSFCTSREVFSAVDKRVDAIVEDFVRYCRSTGQGKSAASRRRILGLHLISDTPAKQLHDTD